MYALSSGTHSLNTEQKLETFQCFPMCRVQLWSERTLFTTKFLQLGKKWLNYKTVGLWAHTIYLCISYFPVCVVYEHVCVWVCMQNSTRPKLWDPNIYTTYVSLLFTWQTTDTHDPPWNHMTRYRGICGQQLFIMCLHCFTCSLPPVQYLAILNNLAGFVPTPTKANGTRWSAMSLKISA